MQHTAAPHSTGIAQNASVKSERSSEEQSHSRTEAVYSVPIKHRASDPKDSRTVAHKQPDSSDDDDYNDASTGAVPPALVR